MRLAMDAFRGLGLHSLLLEGRSERRRRSAALRRAVMETLDPRLLLSTTSSTDLSSSIPLTPQQQSEATLLEMPADVYTLKHPSVMVAPAPTRPAWVTAPGRSIKAGTPEDRTVTAPTTTSSVGPVSKSTTKKGNNITATSPIYGHGNVADDETMSGFYYYGYIYGSMYVTDANHSDNWVSTDSSSNVPTIYVDGSDPSGGPGIYIDSDAAEAYGGAFASELEWAVYNSYGGEVAWGNFSNGYGGYAEAYDALYPGSDGTQYYYVGIGYDENGDGTLEPNEMQLAANIEVVDTNGLTVNGQSGTAYAAVANGGSTTVNVSPYIYPTDLGAASWVTYEASGNSASPSGGNFGSGSQNVTLTPTGGNYNFTINAGFDGTTEQTVNVDLASLTSLTLADTHAGGPSVATTSSTVTPILYLNKPDSGDATFNITPTVAGTLGGSEALCWQITGAGASATSGTSTGTSEISVDGSTSGNWTFTVTAWIDTNGNGQIDSGEPELQATVRVIEPGFVLTDLVSGNHLTDTTNDVGTPSGFVPVTTDGDPSFLQMYIYDRLSTAPLPNVFTYDMESAAFSPVSSGALEPSTDVMVRTPAAGQYFVTVNSTIDTDFNRFIQFEVLQLNIIWDGASLTGVAGATEVSAGDILHDDTSINLLVGQQMVLGYQIGGGTTVQSVRWQVGDEGNFVETFTTEPDFLTGFPTSTPSWGSVTLLSAGDLTGGTLSAYGVADMPGQLIDLAITATVPGAGVLTFLTKTTINFQKPGQSIWSGPIGNSTQNYFQVWGSYDPVAMDGASPDTFEGNASWLLPTPVSIPAAGYVGTWSTIQLIDGIYNVRDPSGNDYEPGTYKHVITAFELDSGDPLPAGSRDSPDIDGSGLGLGYEMVLVLNFEDWMMYTPPGGNSIPVPIQEFTWAAKGTATNTATGWNVVPYYPHKGPIGIKGQNTTAYPQWSAILILS